jgi:hypothetical protein
MPGFCLNRDQPLVIRLELAPMPDADSGVVVQHAQPAQKEIDQYQAYAGNEDNGPLREGFQECPGDRFPTQHVIDNHLERPRFQNFEHADHKNLPQSQYERDTVGPEVFKDLLSHRGTSPFRESKKKMGRPSATLPRMPQQQLPKSQHQQPFA